MRKQRTIQERLEQQVFCFGGDAEGSSDSNTGGGDTSKPGPNTRTDSRGNTVNFNVGPAPVDNTPNFTRTLPNGIVVEDYSRPFGGQVNLSNSAAPAPPQGDMYDNLAVNLPTTPSVSRPDLGAMATGLAGINAPTTPEQAMQQALSAGQFSNGRMELGGGFYAGKTPSGFGLGFETRFAEGGPVTSGIGSLSLPQRMFKSTMS